MIRKAIKLAFLVLFLIAPLSFAEDNIKTFAEKYIQAQKDAWINLKFDGFDALEGPDVAFHNIDGTVTVGREAHKEYIQKQRNNGGEIHQEWKYLMGEGNMFSLSYKWNIKYPNTAITVDGMMVGRLKDGKLVEEWGASKVSTIAEPRK
jgi:hypothetical protein